LLVLILGLFTDLFRIGASHLAFSDLMMIFFGQPASLERLRVPLAEFVSQSLLHGDPPQDTNIDAAVENIIQEMQQDLRTMGVCHIYFCKKLTLSCFIYVSPCQVIVTKTSMICYSHLRLVLCYVAIAT